MPKFRVHIRQEETYVTEVEAATAAEAEDEALLNFIQNGVRDDFETSDMSDPYLPWQATEVPA